MTDFSFHESEYLITAQDMSSARGEASEKTYMVIYLPYSFDYKYLKSTRKHVNYKQ